MFSGTISSEICSNLNQIVSFYTDCENALIKGDMYYGDGNAEVECDCCTDCCSPGPQGECTKRSTSNVDKLQIAMTKAVAPVLPQTEPIVTVIRNLVFAEFGRSSLFEDMDSDYSKALEWIIRDPYTLHFAAKNFGSFSSENSDIEGILTRFTLALFYYFMSGDDWKNCSRLFDFDSPEENYTCVYINRDSEIISGKSRWLSPSHVCSWAGLTCDYSEEAVLKIELSK